MMTSITMLQMNFQKGWRGGERQTIYNMVGFRNAGYHVELLCRKNNPLELAAKKEGFQTHSFESIFSVILFFIFKCRKYDVMHAQTSHIITYALGTKIFHRSKIIFTRRIDNPQKGTLTKWKYRMTDAIIVISNAVKEVIENFIQRSVIVISDIGVERKLDKQHAAALIKDIPLTDNTCIIATTAALTDDKDPVTMLEAVKIIAAERSDIVFLHFGAGPLTEKMRNLIKEYKLERNYYLMGFAEGVEDIFCIIHLFAMSSVMEGLGSSVLDAFLYKIPVVSTDAGGLAEIVGDSRGLLCPKKSPESLAAAMKTIMTQPQTVARLTTSAYNYVKKFHSIEYITNQYIEVIDSVLKKGKI